MKILKRIGWVLLIALVIAQFFGPEKNEGDLTSISVLIAETNPSAEVHTILKESCFDCHSDKTRYPWYNSITPLNYWLADHVKVGKKKLNFSKWGDYTLKRKEHKLEEVYELVEEGEMPLDSYTWTHTEARLSQAQIDAVVNWAKEAQAKYKQQMQAE
ncbi:heme-binding protein [Polaribacter pacificus]|uniref:Heme-binding protein n=1 Tax=Polaribacter pacificus TaxID=1775173 RepID=A0A917MD66_9FLAO|nr:heme-binding domain-containing protein [Polaribacter pacificus]GGG95262.1 heme-binding protein [Polaribacter pacificus]